MIDFNRLRTLDQVEAERKRLEADVAQRQARVERDIRTIQSTWQKRIGGAQRLLRIAECLIPRPSGKTIFGVLSSAVIARILRRRR